MFVWSIIQFISHDTKELLLACFVALSKENASKWYLVLSKTGECELL